MSWSLSRKASKAEARDVFVKPSWTSARSSRRRSPRPSPDESEISISSYGHFNTDGTGSATVQVSVGKPVPTA